MSSQHTEDRNELLGQFVSTNPDYYRKQFERIGSTSRFAWTFNPVAAMLGPIWFGMRGLWNWGLPFVILEAFAFIQLGRGLWGDLGAEARDRIAQIEGTLKFRHQQLEAAIKKEADNVDVFRRTIDSLEAAIGDIRAEAVQAEATAIWVALFGLGMLLVVKFAEGVMANPVLERRFSDWLSDRTIKSGLVPLRTALSAGFVLLIFCVCIIHFSFPGAIAWLADFPTDPNIRLTAISWVEQFFEFIIASGQWLFNIITYGIRAVLDGLEVLFVSTPWPVIASFIILLTGLSAGPRAAIAAGGFLAYMGFSRFLGKGHDNAGPAGNGGLYLDCTGDPARSFLRPPPEVLLLHTPDHGFHADHAGLCVHDPGDCVFRHRQTRRGRHDNDLRRNSCGASHGSGFAWRTGIDPGSGDRLWRVEMVSADKSRPAAGGTIHSGRYQPNNHAQPRHGGGGFADRREGAR